MFVEYSQTLQVLFVEAATVRLEEVLDEREIVTVGAERSTDTEPVPVTWFDVLVALTVTVDVELTVMDTLADVPLVVENANSWISPRVRFFAQNT